MSIVVFNRSAADVSSLVADTHFSLIIASPPWNIGTPYSGSATDDLKHSEYVAWLDDIICAAAPKLSDEGAFLLDTPDFVRRDHTLYYYPGLYERLANNHGLRRSGGIVWVKSTEGGQLHIGKRWRSSDFGSDAAKLHSMTQWLLVFRKQPTVEDSIIVELPVERDDAHPAAWPPSLAETVVARYAKDGDVLDLFMGTGGVAVACHRLGRRFVGFEISPEYVSVAAMRLRRLGADVEVRT